MTTPERLQVVPDPGSDGPPDIGGHLLRLLGPVPATAEQRIGDAGDATARYRAFLDALGVAVYTTDADGRITFFNEAAAQFWGRRPELGELWCGSWRLYWADGRPMQHDECPMAIALKENRPIRAFEAIAERPDGTRVSFVPYPTPLRDESGNQIGAVNVLVDVTERRHAEDALRATAEALRVSNAVKDEFLGLVSHELRTPVTTIFGNARLLHGRGDRLTEDVRQSMVADIAADAERLLGVIENLLLLTRLESGTPPELEPQVLDHIVARAIESFRGRHPTRVVKFTKSGGHHVVEGDRTYLDLLVDNLLGNAHKYSPPGTEIEVALTVRGQETRVAVLDRGIGIAGADPTDLFEPFYRSETAKRWANGMGIGLALCRRIVEMLGGRIWAEPRRGGGSEVGFALPLSRDQDDPSGADA